MTAILWAALVLGGMALIFGILLDFVSRKFAVPSNPTRDAIREVLPGANCGGCGFPGCDGCADAIASGKAPVNACPVGGAEVGAKVAAILGVEAAAGAKKVATVRCQGDSTHCKVKFDYQGIQDCVAATTLGNGAKACQYACLGLGNCTRACPFDAIHMSAETGLPVVDDEKCQSCGKCVAACPRSVLALLPVDRKLTVACHNKDKGKPVMDACSRGCISCGKCVRTCKFEAITMGPDNYPVIDYDKCKGCLMCLKECPTGALYSPKLDHDEWVIKKKELEEKKKAAAAAAAKAAAEKAAAEQAAAAEAPKA